MAKGKRKEVEVVGSVSVPREDGSWTVSLDGKEPLAFGAVFDAVRAAKVALVTGQARTVTISKVG